jgi:hypothetical protein
VKDLATDHETPSPGNYGTKDSFAESVCTARVLPHRSQASAEKTRRNSLRWFWHGAVARRVYDSKRAHVALKLQVRLCRSI